MKTLYSHQLGRSTLAEAKTRLNIHDLWRHFGFEGDAKANCRCPWREDNKPSFSVTPDGTLWHDFATGEGGDAVDFFQRVTGLSKRDAIRKFIELALGGATTQPITVRQWSKPAKAKSKPNFPEFRAGTAAEFQQLADLRHIGREGLEFASERGLLWFASLHDHPAWIVTDVARVNAQARRLDGQPWNHLPGNPKAYTLPGSSASWPIGITEAALFPAIVLCEGGADLLAAHYLALWEQASHHALRDVRCAPVAMLGAAQRIHTDALTLFAGKQVRIFGHADDAGRTAVEKWGRQLAAIGVEVDAFDFSGLERADGQPVKDLNDCLRVNVDGFSQTEGIFS